jgi:hypothetical protein
MQPIQNNLKPQPTDSINEAGQQQRAYLFSPNDSRFLRKYGRSLQAESDSFQLTGVPIPDNSNTP